jgi:hypothetical protein
LADAPQKQELQFDGVTDSPPKLPAPPPPKNRFTPRPKPIPTPRPEPMLPNSPAAVLNNLLVREITNPSGEDEPLSPTVQVLVRLTEGLSTGSDISDIRNEITRIAQHQPEKADLYNAVVNLIDQERATDAIVMRGSTEKIIKRAARRGDLSTGEALAVWKMASEIIKEVQDKQADGHKGVDTVTIVEKVDYAKQQVERTVQQKWENTSSQSREIIRKKLFDLKRQLRAKPVST